MKKLISWVIVPVHLMILLILVSVLGRLASALYMGDTVEEMPGTFDQISYNMLAQRVLAGHGFSFDQDWWPATRAGEPTAHWSFLYTFYLVLVYAIFGAHPLVARLIQAVIFGILQPYLTYRIGARLFGKPAGLVAALLATIYAYFVYYGGTLMTEPFYILAILWVIDISLRLATVPGTEKRIGVWLSLGLAMGLAVLLRQAFLLMLPFFLLWIGWAIYRRKHAFSLWRVFLPLIVVAVIILPFTLYNSARFGSLVLLNTNSGYAFFWGNHPYYGTHFISILPSEKYLELIPTELRSLNEAALDKALFGRAVQFILQDPGRYLLLSLSRIPNFYIFWPQAESGTISNVSRVASFGIFWPFMLAGLILALRKVPGKFGEKMASPLILPLLFIVLYSAVHILTWTLIRYRLPVDAVAIIFAGYIFVEIDRRVLHLGRRLLPAEDPVHSPS